MHLLGLVSAGGVHSHIDHLRALLELARREGMAEQNLRARVHGRARRVAAGRRGRPGRARSRGGDGSRPCCGRYYAMDRDRRWERIERALAAITRGDGIPAERPGRGDRGQLRGRGHRRVHRAGRPAGAAPRSRRRRRLLQLPRRPGAAALPAAARGRLRPDHDDPLPGRSRLPGRVLRARRRRHARGGARGARRAAAAHRRDREVRARHVLPERRPRGGVGGGGARPRALAQGRRHLRPEAGDVGRRGRRALRRARSPGRLPRSPSSTSPTRTWSVTPA